MTLHGADIEIDKRILEELKDPLIHLVRNCVDHGLEKPEVRLRKGKTRRGMITLTFNAKDSRQVEILVSDDGAGIDPEQVRAAAIKAGSLPEGAAEKLTPEETFALIFQSGLSTSEIITDISGRGLGLAIVREKVEKLGGLVSVESQVWDRHNLSPPAAPDPGQFSGSAGKRPRAVIRAAHHIHRTRC